MTLQRKMKRTVPGSDQVVLVRKLLGANIAHRKRDLRISLLRRRDHFFGNIQSGALKSPLHQNSQKPAFATAADIQYAAATMLDKHQGTLQCWNAVGRSLHLLKPPRC